MAKNIYYFNVMAHSLTTVFETLTPTVLKLHL